MIRKEDYMKNYTIKYHNFITIYNMLLLHFSKKNSFYQICFYYLDNKFNIEFIDAEKNIICFKDSLKISFKEYNDLVCLLGYEFINNYDVYLPLFQPIRLDEVKYYYNSHDSFQPLDYDKAKVHVLKNNKFELRIYYFKGLNQISIDMQSEAMKKLNNKDNKNKVYRLK